MDRIVWETARMAPDQIEKTSFAIIEEKLQREYGKILPEEQAPIIKRVIHTTADFSYADTLCFSPGVVDLAKQAIKNGASVITDTNMAKAGIHRKTLEKYGGKIHCFMADEDVAVKEKSMNVTRAAVSMEKSAATGENYIYAIGNAPTALIKLYELIQEEKVKPVLIIGVPVGFVNVAEAKELIMQTDVPYIIARGQKGGSSVAAAICNALLYETEGRRLI